MKLSAFKTNLESSEQGQWVALGSDNAKVKVARIGNKQYQAFIKKATKPYAAAMRSKAGISDEVFEKIIAEAMADSILLDWRGIKDDEGNDIPYSKQKALEILTDPAYKDFAELISSLANEAETFRDVEVAEITGK